MRAAPLALLLTSLPALACDAPQIIQSSAPADGAIDVPLNARLFVFFEHGGDNWIDFDLSTGGQPVGASTAVRFGGELTTAAPAVALITPGDPLLPETTYTLKGSSDSLEVDGSPGAWTISFTTGTTADTTAPAYDGISGAGFQVSPASAAVDCDQAPRRWRFNVTGSEPAPDADIVAYAVYRSSFPVVTGATPALVYETLPEGGTQPICMTVQAIDQAGNLSTSTAEKCATPSEDDPEDTGDTGGDTDTDTDSNGDTGWRETGRWEDTWREGDSWWWEGGDSWRGDWGRSGLTVRVCGPGSPGTPVALFPALLLVLLGRRRTGADQ